jgi:plastocyanin
MFMNIARRAMLLSMGALVLSGCATANAPSRSVKLTMTDFTFLPNTVTVPAGEEIDVSVVNSGAVPHSILIMKLGQQVDGHFGPEDQANAFWEHEQVEAGETIATTFVSPSEPGEYQIVCTVAGHVEAGMVGTMIVVVAP